MSSIQRIILLFIGAFGTAAIVTGVAIAVTPGHFKEDSGVTACKTLAKNVQDKKSGSDNPMTKAQYEKARTPFENSSYSDIRVAGTNVISTVYKADSKKIQDGDIGHAIALMNVLETQWGALQTACGNHGVTVPALPMLG